MPLTRFKLSAIADGGIETADLADGAVTLAKTDNLFENTTFTGDDGIVVPKGTTAERPASPVTGYLRYNTTIELLEQYTADGWQAIAAPPAVTSVNISYVVEGDDPQTFVVSGSNFDSNATGVLVNNGGSTVTPTTSTRNSANQITISFSGGDVITTDDGPWDIRITNGSGLSGTLENALEWDATPTFTTSAGNLFTVYEDVAEGGTLSDGSTTTDSYVDVEATDPDGGSVTFAVTSGALPTGLSISSGGIITGTANGGSSDYAAAGVTHNFTVTATDDESNTSTRIFNIVRKWQDGSNSTVPGISCYHIRAHAVGSDATMDNGLYYINPTTGPSGTFQVYCDMNTDGGGWTMLWDGNSAIPPDNSSNDIYNGNPSNSYYSTTARAPMIPDGTDGIAAGASNSKLYARDWQGYHRNNRGSANNGQMDFMMQRRSFGETESNFDSDGKSKFIVNDITWLTSNSSQTNLPGSGGSNNAYGYWWMDNSNGTAKWGDGTTYSRQNDYIRMSSCFNDLSTCDEWHSTHISDTDSDGYIHLNDASTSQPLWGHTFGNGNDASPYNYMGWYNNSTQEKESASGDRDVSISHWVRNRGTW